MYEQPRLRACRPPLRVWKLASVQARAKVGDEEGGVLFRGTNLFPTSQTLSWPHLPARSVIGQKGESLVEPTDHAKSRPKLKLLRRKKGETGGRTGQRQKKQEGGGCDIRGVPCPTPWRQDPCLPSNPSWKGACAQRWQNRSQWSESAKNISLAVVPGTHLHQRIRVR